jgi:hypothetical protein
MTLNHLEELGFKIEQLPSGRFNLINDVPFRINELTTIVASRGKWTMTINRKTIQEVLQYIEKLEILEITRTLK